LANELHCVAVEKLYADVTATAPAKRHEHGDAGQNGSSAFFTRASLRHW
jgi:hypothetical protein